MKRLLLLRHAKSDRSDGGVDDFDRPLAPRGERAAPVMGRYLQARKLIPDLVLCSSALRARRTWDLVLPELKAAPQVAFRKGLYLAPPSRLLAAVRRTPAAVKTLMLIGHNPGMEGLALRLAGGGRAKDLAAMAAKFPSGALAVIAFDLGDWAGTAEGAGRLETFIRPKDLA